MQTPRLGLEFSITFLKIILIINFFHCSLLWHPGVPELLFSLTPSDYRSFLNFLRQALFYLFILFPSQKRFLMCPTVYFCSLKISLSRMENEWTAGHFVDRHQRIQRSALEFTSAHLGSPQRLSPSSLPLSIGLPEPAVRCALLLAKDRGMSLPSHFILYSALLQTQHCLFSINKF